MSSLCYCARRNALEIARWLEGRPDVSWVRYSTGIEDVHDLIDDLRQALESTVEVHQIGGLELEHESVP